MLKWRFYRKVYQHLGSESLNALNTFLSPLSEKMFCHTKSPKSPHGLCLWRYYPIFMSARLFPTFLVPVYDESEVTDEETDEVKHPGLVDDVLQSSHVLNVVFIHRKHQCVLAASYLSAAYRLIDWFTKTSERGKEVDARSSVIPAFPRNVLLLALSTSATCGETSDSWVKGLSVPSSYWNMKVFSERGAPLLWSRRPCLNLASDQFPHGQRRRRRFWIMVTWVTYGRRSDFCFWRFFNDFVSFVAAHRDSSRFSDYWRWWDIQRLKITFNLRNIIFKFIDL